MKPVRFTYYEDGKKQVLSMRDVYRQYRTMVDEEQKAEGTTFRSWLSEMEHMQILNKI